MYNYQISILILGSIIILVAFWFINSTLKEDLSLDVCSSCHPFYTGKQKLVDTSGRVEKFEKRFGKKDKVNKTQTKDQEEATSDEELKGEVAETSAKQSATKESVNKKSKEKKETKDSPNKTNKQKNNNSNV